MTAVFTGQDQPGWPVCGVHWDDLPDDLYQLLEISLDETDMDRATAAAVKHREREKTLRELPRIRAALEALPPAPSLAVVDAAPDPRVEPGFEPWPGHLNGSSGFIPPETPATVQPVPDLAREPGILTRFAKTIAKHAVAGERRVVQLIYLAATSRVLPAPVSVAVKGPSSSGKSYLVKEVLAYFPASAYYSLTSGSEKAFIYSEESLVHRMLVIYEAQGMAGDMQTYLIRTLLSEGHIRHETVVKTKEGVKGKLIDRPGPTGLITTTTAIALHPENETRLLSLTVTDTAEQTAAVMLAHALGHTAPREVSAWHDLQTWLAADVRHVVVPYAVELARAIPPVAVRLRRDFPTIISLIKAHALLEQVHRERDGDAVVATLDDYAIVRELVADVVGDAVGRTVSATVRATVAAVSDLTLGGGSTTALKVAAALKLDKSAGWRRVRSAIERGFVRNLEDRRGQPAQLVLGDPLPEDLEILPTVERLHGCMQSAGDKADDEATLRDVTH